MVAPLAVLLPRPAAIDAGVLLERQRHDAQHQPATGSSKPLTRLWPFIFLPLSRLIGLADTFAVAFSDVVFSPFTMAGMSPFAGPAMIGAARDTALSGVAIEHPTVTTIRIDLIKHWPLRGPRLETADWIMTIGSARPMEDAARIAYRELIRWMASDYGFTETDAYMLLSQAGRMRVGNMVDPKYSLGASIKKSLLG